MTESEAFNEIVKADEMMTRQEQARRAYELKQAGYSWWRIAEMMRIPEGQIRKRVKDELAEAAALVTEGARRDLLDLEIDRIDRLQLAVWDEALAGDRQAVETVLKLIMSRAKLLGLEDAASASSGIHTVVVQGNSEEYIAALRKIREHSEREAADGR